MDESVKKCFLMISIVGEVKASYMKSIQEARHNDFEKAKEYICQGDEIFSKIYDIQNQLTQEEMNGILNDYHLLLIHAQDQVMSVEQVKVLALEMSICYQRIFDLEQKLL